MHRPARRPCPRGLYDGCPIPRELCADDLVQAGEWRCLERLEDFEGFVFPAEADTEGDAGAAVSLDDLLRVLEDLEREG